MWPLGRAGGLRVPRGPSPREEAGTYQQAVGAVDGHAAGEGVVDGEVPDGGGRVVASPAVQVPRQVEMDRVLAHQLLPHVLQLHALQVRRREPQCELRARAGRASEAAETRTHTVPRLLR